MPEAAIREVRELAKKFTAGQIEACLTEQISEGTNVCLTGSSPAAIINELSKADLVRTLMDKEGMTLADAVRELARRIRKYHLEHEAETKTGGKE